MRCSLEFPLSFVLLSLCSCSQETDAFECGSSLSSTCRLRQGKTFWGLYLGMEKSAAFKAVCSGEGSRHLSNPKLLGGAAPPASNRSLSRSGPVKCEYEAQVEQLDYWIFDSTSSLCWGPREESMAMEFTENRLSYLVVTCGVIDF